MDCARARELFSDHLEGNLDPSLRGELHDHLVTCRSCAALRAAFGEVVDTLRTAPELPVPLGLVDRVIEATRRLAKPRARLRPPAMPRWMQAAAAVVAVALTAGVLSALSADTRARFLRMKQRTERFGIYVVERKDRAVEELRLLRILVGTALEGRVDRVNDQVEDYRRLLERRRAAEPQPGESKDQGSPRGGNFPNFEAPRLVDAGERDESARATRRSHT
ncbi:MAG TPA: zf-HC2 domain-containing protein [Vicinamibacteria bacterium]|nr:zf-HC2 domain-containing protein [Vicinamibacteria bacterium]